MEIFQRQDPPHSGLSEKSAWGGAAQRECDIILSEILKNPTRDFLSRTGVRTGMHGLQLNCGVGTTTFQIAQAVGTKGSITGWDTSSVCVEIARKKGNQKGLHQAVFEHGDIKKDSNSGPYDFIFHRVLFGHAIELDSFIRVLAQKLRPGGMLLIEMIDLTKHYCHPFSYAHEQYIGFVNLYIKMIKSNQLSAAVLSQRLNAMYFENTRTQVIRPTFLKGDGRKLAALFLEAISQVVIDSSSTTRVEVAAILDELKTMENEKGILMSLPSVYQICAVRK